MVRQGTIQQMVSQQAAAAIREERNRKLEIEEGLEIVEAMKEQQEIAAAARKENRDKQKGALQRSLIIAIAREHVYDER